MLQYLIGREQRRETNQAELTVKDDLSIIPLESRDGMIPLGFDSALHSPCRGAEKIPVESEALYYHLQQEGM